MPFIFAYCCVAKDLHIHTSVAFKNMIECIHTEDSLAEYVILAVVTQVSSCRISMSVDLLTDGLL